MVSGSESGTSAAVAEGDAAGISGAAGLGTYGE